MAQISVLHAEGPDGAYTSVPGPSIASSPHAPVDAPDRKGGRRPRLAALDGMRLLAALAVVGYHYVSLAPANWGSVMRSFPRLSLAFNYGWLGVNLFFLISGFVICMSSWGRGLGDFFVSRAIRLFPAYWTAVLLTTAVATVLPTSYGRRPSGEVLLNLTMLQQGMNVDNIDPAYWTLWQELMFYLLFAIVVWRGVTYRRTVAFCMLWTVASVLSVWTSVPALKNLVGSEYSMYFIAGIAMYLMHRFRPTVLLWGIVGVSWALAMYNLTKSTADQSRIVVNHPLSSHVAAGVVTVCFGMVLAVALGWSDRVRWRWLTVAGGLTYPLYLVHQIIGYAVIRWLTPHVEKHLLVGVLVLVMLAVAWLIHRLVERPLAPRFKRALIKAFADLRHDVSLPEDSLKARR